MREANYSVFFFSSMVLHGRASARGIHILRSIGNIYIFLIISESVRVSRQSPREDHFLQNLSGSPPTTSFQLQFLILDLSRVDVRARAYKLRGVGIPLNPSLEFFFLIRETYLV